MPKHGRQMRLASFRVLHLDQARPPPRARRGRIDNDRRDENGVELFYNLRIKPGCHLTPDLQVIQPGLAPLETAILFGLRLKLDF